ncbi:hypothetical protein CASFOL_012272 [Castilleja foliolosa]|uniref:GIY-YIG homing endonuclease n=1 Tax=Castilleja foliolosa TaxID=1961234 RepID=A0ABD3DPV9_9LAMI
MGVPSSATTGERLRREDFRRTKHDSAFSHWKILIGPFDWESYSVAKGAERYRTQNLPKLISCPGVYELGIAASRPHSRRETRKYDSTFVVPVYIGQADNLRTRLQQYGRDGNHLENGCSNNKLIDCESVLSHKGPRLFTDIFSKGLPIVYRCAPMKSKKDAVITERQLLDKFDYAWNKGSNGARRQDDIFTKLDHLAKQSQLSLLAKKFLFANWKQVGVKIKTCEPGSPKNDNESNSSNKDTNITTFSRIFKIKRLQPTQVQQYGSRDICGVAIGRGIVCTTPPIEGRKRCNVHKGMRVNGYVSKLSTESKVVPPAVAVVSEQNVVDFQDHHLFAPACGFIMENGCACELKPVPRNKRCLMHKGRRIGKSQALQFQVFIN